MFLGWGRRRIDAAAFEIARLAVPLRQKLKEVGNDQRRATVHSVEQALRV